jgi:hypothetical protein
VHGVEIALRTDQPPKIARMEPQTRKTTPMGRLVGARTLDAPTHSHRDHSNA